MRIVIKRGLAMRMAALLGLLIAVCALLTALFPAVQLYRGAFLLAIALLWLLVRLLPRSTWIPD